VLRAGLTDEDPRVRANAVEAIGLSGDPTLIAELRPLLDSASPRELANVVVALARLPAHREAARARLELIFWAEDRKLLASALWAAGELTEASFLPAVRRYLNDADAMVRRNAIIALGKLGQPEAIDPMVKLLLGGKDDAFAMARALGRLDGREREALVMHLSQLSRQERAPALFALTHCGLNYPDELDQLA
jgi:HEAT repeat protein